MSNFYPLQIVGRYSDKQLEVGENLGYEFSILSVNIYNSITLIWADLF